MKEKHTELSLLVEQVILGESEQLDELKASTLGSYMGKSAKSERKLAEPENEVFRQYYKKTSDMSPEDKEVEREKLIKTTSEKKYRDAKKKIDNRRKGFQQAIKKLDTGDFQESILDQLSDAIEYLDEDQIQIVAEMVVELMETSYDRELDPKKPIIVHGVKGMKSTPFKKKFKNMDAYDKWTDTDEYGNHEVHSVQNQDQYNEDVEQIDELKKTTLGSYIKKASDDSVDAAHDLGKVRECSDEVDRFTNRLHTGFKERDEIKKMLKATPSDEREKMEKVYKRSKGIKAATDKLVKGQYQEEYIEEALSELITGVVLDEAPGVKRASKSEVEPYSVGTFVNTPFGGGRITHFKEGNSIRPHQYRVLLPKTKNTHANKERYSPWVGHGAVSKPSEG